MVSRRKEDRWAKPRPGFRNFKVGFIGGGHTPVPSPGSADGQAIRSRPTTLPAGLLHYQNFRQFLFISRVSKIDFGIWGRVGMPSSEPSFHSHVDVVLPLYVVGSWKIPRKVLTDRRLTTFYNREDFRRLRIAFELLEVVTLSCRLYQFVHAAHAAYFSHAWQSLSCTMRTWVRYML